MADETLVPVFMPPLVTVLAQHERQKGSPLTKDEVLAIRGKSVVMMMRQSIAQQMAQMRGYHDVDPQACWQEWQQAREFMKSLMPNHALQRTRLGRHGCSPRASHAGSLSLGR